MGLPSSIEGIGPEIGITDLSICPYEKERNASNNKFI